MGVKVSKVEDGFVVSHNGVWVEGFFATEAAARKAIKLHPDDLHRIWEAEKAKAGVGAILTEDMI